MEERGLKIFVPEEEEPGKDSSVFYNKDMKNNRDISWAALKVFREKVEVPEFNIADALAASGIRGFRYSGQGNIHLNDTNPRAIESIEKGLEENDIEAEVSESDANVFLSENRNFFHLIDVDPFGPFTPYLDSTARAANYQSFVGLTATDNAVPAGSYKKTCMRRYGSTPMKNALMHETGLRIYIKEAFQNFARYDKCFDPKICWHERHYTRVMGRVTESKSRANRTLENIGYMSFCPQCRWRKLERVDKCGHCGAEVKVAGPLWTGKISDQRFTSEVLEEMPEDWESREIVELLDSEAEILTPFYDLHKMASSTGLMAPKREDVIENLREKGYPVSRTHFTPTGIRTDAPLEDVISAMKD
ncbi:tRNA (guanine(10)-N(2))-dimethyltransferase [Candidatus Nanohalovita haloferacivicina]|uniref:tRNA (guanine(10)-N(2))-dimethyltransferase n=1 Tax=Candidatus Nanohalovita haloferacivicina TaxID=2978046 RepID=UPI00325FB787|nr:tRNA (guanine26-N2/guanine27-N2)-dimethyltransferase [Candidatus Nanohalobia archaeon BNXNv]